MSPAPATVRLLLERLRGDAESTHTYLDGLGGEEVLTHDALYTRAAELGRRFLGTGLRTGDRIGLVLIAPGDFCPAFLGAILAGLVPVPLYPPLAIGRLDAWLAQTAGMLRAAGARLLVTTADLRRVVFSIVDQVPGLLDVVVADALSEQIVLPDPHAVKPTDLCFLQFTSGSTASPKGVRVTHANLVANAVAIMVDGLGVRPEDRGFSWLPLYHDMGLIGFVLAPLLTRTSVSFLPTLAFLRDPMSWLQGLDRQRATITFAPNFAYALATSRGSPEGLRLDHVRFWGCGAEPIHPETMRAFVAHYEPAGLNASALFPCYGLAESTLAVSFPKPGEGIVLDRVASTRLQRERVATPPAEAEDSVELVASGRPLPGYAVDIVDPKGKPLPERHIGEIVLRGPCVADGYHGLEEPTRAAFTPAGLRTGDLGYLAEGRLYVSGRKKDLLIVAGRNIDPQAVEHIVAEVAGVRKGSAVAISRPAAQTEEVVVIAETREADLGALATAIRRAVQSRLGVAVADVVLLAPGLVPKTSSGKIQRALARSQYLDGTLGNQGSRTKDNKSRLVVARHVARSTLSRIRHSVVGKNKNPPLGEPDES